MNSYMPTDSTTSRKWTNFYETYNLNQEEIDNLNRLITSSEIEFVI